MATSRPINPQVRTPPWRSGQHSAVCQEETSTHEAIPSKAGGRVLLVLKSERRFCPPEDQIAVEKLKYRAF